MSKTSLKRYWIPKWSIRYSLAKFQHLSPFSFTQGEMNLFQQVSSVNFSFLIAYILACNKFLYPSQSSSSFIFYFFSFNPPFPHKWKETSYFKIQRKGGASCHPDLFRDDRTFDMLSEVTEIGGMRGMQCICILPQENSLHIDVPHINTFRFIVSRHQDQENADIKTSNWICDANI